MQVLVTGQDGYIGSVLFPLLIAQGHALVGLDIGLYGSCGFPGRPVAVRQLPKDLRDVSVADLRGFDAVIHLAGLCNDAVSAIDPTLTMEVNHRGSLRLAKLSRDAGVSRFIYASECSLHGQPPADDLVNEDAPLCPRTPYGESKARTEDLLRDLADTDFSPIVLRFATAYGMSPRLRSDVTINHLVGRALTSGRIQVDGNGSQWQSVVHVEDIARACAACLDAPRAMVHNQAINVGRPEDNYRLRDLIDIVRATVPGTAVEFLREHRPHTSGYGVDFSKATRLLPTFQPAWTVPVGTAQLQHALRDRWINQSMFTGPRFTRSAEIHRLRAAGALDAELRWMRREMHA